LVFFDPNTLDVILDGIYTSETEIKSIFFSSDSMVTIIDSSGLKLLNTRKFC